MKNYYITTAIAYTSGKPHIGNIYEIILTDSIARFKRFQGYNVFFQTGTDEHGQKIEEKALAKGVTPKQFVDNVAGTIKDLWDKANISYSRFIRTTDEDHEKQVQKIFKKLYDQGDIYKGSYEGMYCTPCESFWTESQLVDGKCPDCGREVKKAKEEAYFFRMSKYADRLVEYYNSHPDFVQPVSRKNEMVNNFINKGLQDLCVSRTSFKWGIPVTFDPKHVVYVWLDALTNYITGIGYDVDGNHKDNFKKFWPADLHVIGKDIVRFHIIYWPIFLMALGLPLPKKVYGHGWLLQDGEKMSKSKGNVMYFDDLAEVFGADAVRYYVLNEMSFDNDGTVGWEMLTDKINSDLANVYGNLVSRTIAMTNKYFGGKVVKAESNEEVDNSLKEVVKNAYAKVEEKIDNLRISDSISEVMSIFRRANKYIDETCPWVLAKEGNTERLNAVLYNLCEAIMVGTTLLKPYMPTTADKVATMMGAPLRTLDNISTFGYQPEYCVTDAPEVLFPRLDIKEVLKKAEAIKEKQLKEYQLENQKVENKEEVVDNKKPIIDFDAFEKVELKVGTILNSEKVEGSEKLLKNTVKLGDETRTIVSGIAKTYKPEDIIGRQVVVVTNLAPRKLKGIVSEGMILCASDEKTNDLSVISPISQFKDGCEVS